MNYFSFFDEVSPPIYCVIFFDAIHRVKLSWPIDLFFILRVSYINLWLEDLFNLWWWCSYANRIGAKISVWRLASQLIYTHQFDYMPIRIQFLSLFFFLLQTNERTSNKQRKKDFSKKKRKKSRNTWTWNRQWQPMKVYTIAVFFGVVVVVACCFTFITGP